MSTTVSNIGKVATFLRGLIYMIPFQLCLVGSSFAMRRFGYDNEAVPIFVAFCSNAMTILHMVASLSTVVIVTILKYGSWTKCIFTQISSGMSIVAVWVTIVVNVLLLRLYSLDDDVDNVTRYYWLLVLALFLTGIDITCVFTLAADDLSPYDLGYNSSGLAVVGFHLIVIKILECIGANVDYWLIVLQLVFTVGISLYAAVVWVWFLFQDKIMHSSGHTVSSTVGVKSNASGLAKGFAKCLPVVLGYTVSMGYLWAIYPYISPYEVTPFEYHYPIQRVCLVARAISGFINFFLGQYGGVRSDWYKYPYAWWHILWISYIPYLGIGFFIIRCLHYPESGLHRVVLSSPFVVGVLTVVFYIIGRITQGASSMAIAMNAGDNLKEIIAPLNRTLGLIAMNVLKYMSEAHIQEFRLAKEGLKAGKAWPTYGMSKHTAIQYWIRNAARVGYVNFKELASADVKQRLGGVARHIVSYRRIGSTV